MIAPESEQSLSIEDLLRAISLPLSTRQRPLRTERINVAHVADSLRRYPGERLHFFTRVQAREALSGFNLEILVPSSLGVQEATVLSGHVTVQPGLVKIDQGTYVIWKIERLVETGDEFEFCIECVVHQREDNVNVLSRALVSARSQEHGDALEDEETAAVFVTVQAQYTRFLPAIYAQDRFMNRFLMLFESFWDPIQQQIAGIENYFDPTVTPADFLPWLSSWIALPMSEEEEAPPTSRTPITAGAELSLDSSHLLSAPVDPLAGDGGFDASGTSPQLASEGGSPGVAALSAQTGQINDGDSGLFDINADLDITDGADGDDATGTGIILARAPWQARQVHLPLPARGTGSSLTTWATEGGLHAVKSAREPLILPSAAENARQLLKVAQQLHKRRGTRRGLQQYLEIYTDTEVHVIEHRAENFVLRDRAALGSRVALGHNNHPHSFTVIIRFHVRQEKLALFSEEVLKQRKDAVRRRVIPIIEEQKPAHTTYHLQIEVVSI
jgi:hypothetical protein